MCCLKSLKQMYSKYLVYKVMQVTHFVEHNTVAFQCVLGLKNWKSFSYCTKGEYLLHDAALQLRWWQVVIVCLTGSGIDCLVWRASAWSSQNCSLRRQNPSTPLHSILLQLKGPKPNWVYKSNSSACRAGTQTTTHILEATGSSSET